MGVIALGTIFGTLCGARTTTTSSTAKTERVEETATPEVTATGTPNGSVTPTVTPAPTATPPIRRYSAPPPMSIDPEKQYFATIKTDKGDIRIQLFPKEAPQTVNNFVFLARNNFYDGLTFHRVIDGFVAQSGDPDGSGAGGPGYTLPLEKSTLKNDTGAVAMASSAAGVSGSQFYIDEAPQPSLDGGPYPVFGKVVSGQEVVSKLTPRDPQRNPRAPIGDKIQSITIEER